LILRKIIKTFATVSDFKTRNAPKSNFGWAFAQTLLEELSAFHQAPWLDLGQDGRWVRELEGSVVESKNP